jgi:hypothetical protein
MPIEHSRTRSISTAFAPVRSLKTADAVTVTRRVCDATSSTIGVHTHFCASNRSAGLEADTIHSLDETLLAMAARRLSRERSSRQMRVVNPNTRASPRVDGSEAHVATIVEKHRTDGERFRVPERNHGARERDREERDELRLWYLLEPRNEAEVDLARVRDFEARERTAITNRVAPARDELLAVRPTLKVRRPDRMDVRKSTSDECPSDLVAKVVRIIWELVVASRDGALELSRTVHDGVEHTTRTESIALVGHASKLSRDRWRIQPSLTSGCIWRSAYVVRIAQLRDGLSKLLDSARRRGVR